MNPSPPFDPDHDRHLLGRARSVVERDFYFVHVSERLFSPGHRLSSGEIRTYGQPDRVLVEKIFEEERLSINPESPSRTNCIFAWTCLECAKSFSSRFRTNRLIHAYILQLEPRSSFIVLDMSWQDCAMLIAKGKLDRATFRDEGAVVPEYGSPEEGIRTCAVRYWQGSAFSTQKRFQRIESLIAGHARVVGDFGVRVFPS
jgi:hypothetical protein